MAYKEKRYFFRDSIEIERSHTGRYGSPGRGRQKKKKATPEDIEKQNQTNKGIRVRRLIKWNFIQNDYWMTFTYRQGTIKTMEEAKEDYRKFIRKLKTEYKKRGHTLKYIVRTDVGIRGAAHHHLVINRIPDGDQLIAGIWRCVCPDAGHIDVQLLYDRGDYKQLAEYIVKKNKVSKKEIQYSRSRNLIQKDPDVKDILRKELQDDPIPWKGMYVDKDSVVQGINPVTGYRYQHFTMVYDKKDSEGGRGRDCGHLHRAVRKRTQKTAGCVRIRGQGRNG